MRLRIFWVGRTKAAFLNQGIEYYLGLLRGHASVSVCEIREAKGLPQTTAVTREGERILKQASSYALLDEAGMQLTSVDFARLLGRRNDWDFVVGGPFGVSQAVREGAEHTLSLSRMTFTHEMARLILLEQLFRGLSIMKKRGYHH